MNQNEHAIGKFLFILDWPEEVKKVIVPLVEELQWFVPAWCHIVVLTWKPNLKAGMECSTEYDYRRIRISLGPCWLDESPYQRFACLKHELVHGFTSPFYNYVVDLVKRLIPAEEEKKWRDIFLEELREKNEGITEDMTQCLMQKYHKDVK